MKKNNILLLLFFFCGITLVQGQITTTTTTTTTTTAAYPYPNEIGVNVTSFVQNVLGFNEDLPNASPYQLTYKRHLNAGKNALRIGFGGDIRITSEDTEGNPTTRESVEWDMSLRAGYEWRYTLGKRWLAYWGLDATFEYDKTSSTASDDFDEVKTNTDIVGFGGGPVFGIQFNITDRLNLSTESTLYLLYEQNTREVTSLTLPELFNEKQTTTNTLLRSTVPISIFLKFRL